MFKEIIDWSTYILRAICLPQRVTRVHVTIILGSSSDLEAFQEESFKWQFASSVVSSRWIGLNDGWREKDRRKWGLVVSSVGGRYGWKVGSPGQRRHNRFHLLNCHSRRRSSRKSFAAALASSPRKGETSKQHRHSKTLDPRSFGLRSERLLWGALWRGRNFVKTRGRQFDARGFLIWWKFGGRDRVFSILSFLCACKRGRELLFYTCNRWNEFLISMLWGCSSFPQKGEGGEDSSSRS